MKHIDWARPDYNKVTGEKQTLDMVLLDIISEGLADTKADALKFVRVRVAPESRFQRKIMEALRKRAAMEGLPCKVWKAAQGPYSVGGVSDVLAIIGGVFFAVEVKRPFFGEMSELQRKFIEEVNAAGGVAGCCVYPEELEPLWQNAEQLRKIRSEK